MQIIKWKRFRERIRIMATMVHIPHINIRATDTNVHTKMTKIIGSERRFNVPLFNAKKMCRLH